MTSLTEQQQEAVYSVDVNVLVSAGAGSGKTHVLVERYVQILKSNPDLTIDGIIAVTFTRKAAGEMRTRLKGRFKELSQSEVDSARWTKCLADIDSARIGTIHSLCETILKAFPAESGIDPQFEVIDEVSQAQILQDSIDQTFREIIDGNLPEIALLAEHNIEDIRRWLCGLLKASLQFQEASQKLLTLDARELCVALNDIRHRVQLRMLQDAVAKAEWKQAHSYLAETFARDKLEQLRLHVVQAADLLTSWCRRDHLTSDDSAELWERLDVLAGADLRVGGHSEEAKEVKKRIGVLRAIARKLIAQPPLPPRLGDDDMKSFENERHIAAMFARSFKLYSERKMTDLVLDYNDLIALAFQTLHSDNSAARRHYQECTRAILVDEFQDTNQLQADLLGFLAGPETRLFLIGDDKQSIYKFQGADVSTFNEWRNRMENRSDSPLHGISKLTKLTVSFRSHPAIVAFVNAVFSNLLAVETTDAPYRARFEALQAARAAELPRALEPAEAAPADGAVLTNGEVLTNAVSFKQLSIFDLGAIAPEAGPMRAAGTTQVFGAGAPQVAGTTHVFGGGTPQAAGTTQVFGASSPQAAGTTQVFGASSPQAAGITQVFASGSMPGTADIPQCHIGDPEPRPSTVPRSNTSTFGNVEVLIFDTNNEEGERLAEQANLLESRAVAKWIEGLIEDRAETVTRDGTSSRVLSYGDFAVLVPKNSQFKAIELGLAERRIPYVTFAGRGFLNRQEIIDMENLLFFLGNPLDSHALLGVLRSPMFALSDDILHEVCTQALKKSSTDREAPVLWHTLQDVVKARRNGYEVILQSVNMLRRFIDDASRLTLTALIRGIIQKTQYDIALMSVESGKQRSRNLWKLVSLAKEHEDLSCYEFAERLSLMREFELKQTDAPFESQNAVKLMTIHASKGLEFPAVALPCLSSRLVSQESRLIFHRDYGFALDTSRGDNNNRPPWFRYARLLDRDMEVAERKRLLYVAMTRARDYLGIFLEKDCGQQQESFRTWMSEILNLELQDPEFIGVQNIRNGNHLAEYNLRRFSNAELLFDPRLKTRDSFIETNADADAASVHAALIDPILSDPVLPHSSWNGWARITPSPGEKVTLDATTIGVFLHAILENLPASLERPDVLTLECLAQSSLGTIVAHPERMRLLLNEGNKLLDIFYESELFALMHTARKRLKEVPYSIRRNMAGKTDLNEDPAEELADDPVEEPVEQRRPDLLLQDNDGNWIVIDYKTDHIEEKQIQSQSRLHIAQLETYANDLQRLTGASFTTRLYFARLGKLVNPADFR